MKKPPDRLHFNLKVSIDRNDKGYPKTMEALAVFLRALVGARKAKAVMKELTTTGGFERRIIS